MAITTYPPYTFYHIAGWTNPNRHVSFRYMMMFLAWIHAPQRCSMHFWGSIQPPYGWDPHWDRGWYRLFILRMSPKTYLLFFSFATIKAIDEYCGLFFLEIFHSTWPLRTTLLIMTFITSSRGVDATTPSPFVMWDKILGTYKALFMETKTWKVLEPWQKGVERLIANVEVWYFGGCVCVCNYYMYSMFVIKLYKN